MGSHTDLNSTDKECIKMNFRFYMEAQNVVGDKNTPAAVERFELPMVL